MADTIEQNYIPKFEDTLPADESSTNDNYIPKFEDTIDIKEVSTEPTLKEMQRSNMKQSMLSASQTNPDVAADALRISKETGLPQDVVQRNYDKLKEAQKVHGVDYDGILDKTPNTAKYFEDPVNASVARDDIDHLTSVEKKIKEYGFFEKAGAIIGYGSASLGAMASKIPELAVNVALIPENIYLYATDQEMVKYTPDTAMTKGFEDLKKQYAEILPELEMSVSESLKKGDYSKAGKVALTQVAAQAPQQLALLASYMSGYGSLGLVGLSAMSAAESAKEDITATENPISATGGAIVKGAFEGVFERLGGLLPFEKWAADLTKSFGKETAKELIKNSALAIGSLGLSEASEEVATEFSQSFTDVVTGVNRNALDGVTGRMIDAGLIGGLSGASMTAPSAILTARGNARAIKQAEERRQFYLDLGKDVSDSKLFQRSPEKFKEYMQEVTKDGPIENIYIPVDDFKTYMQGKNIDPVGAALELGISDQYKDASESGHDIKIPLADFANNIATTEHHAGLKDDIKFNPDQMTYNQTKRETEIIKKEIEAAQAEALDTQKPVETAQDLKVKENVKTQLIQNTGMSTDQAEANAVIAESFFKTFVGERAGLDAQKVFDDLNITIQKGDQVIKPELGKEVISEDLKPSDEEIKILEQSGIDIKKLPGTNVVDASAMFSLKKPIEKQIAVNQDILSQEQLANDEIETEVNKYLGEYPDASQKDILKTIRAKLDKNDPLYSLKEKRLTNLVSPELAIKNKKLDALNISQENKKTLQSIADRNKADDKTVLTKIIKAQNVESEAYSVQLENKTVVPNYESKPTGVIGKEGISQPNAGLIDQLAWVDSKYEATKELIRKHQEANIPLEINTSSDLIGRDDYIEVLPANAEINLYVGTKDDAINKVLFPGNPSRARLESAANKLKDLGFKVKIVEPTMESLSKSLGENPEVKISKWFEVSEDEARKMISDKLRPELKILEQRKLNEVDQKEFKLPNLVNKITIKNTNKINGSLINKNKQINELSSNFGNKKTFVNSHTNKSISVDRKTIDKIISYALKTIKNKDGSFTAKTTLETIQNLKSIIESSVFLTKSTDYKSRDNRGWEYYFAPLNIDGKEFYSKIEVMHKNGEYKLHNLVLVDSRYARESARDNLYRLSSSPLQPDHSGTEQRGDIPINSFLENVNSLRDRFTFFQDEEAGPRGQIKIGDQAINIEVFKSADKSTVLHEMGHLYLEVFNKIALNETTPEDIKADHKVIFEWLSKGTGIEINPGELITTDHHEYFARGIEAYVMEGKAPSDQLRKAFARFKNWLLDIYKSVLGLNVELSPEVKDVFDRMLASREEIAKEKAFQLFKGNDFKNMTVEKQLAYEKAIFEAKEASEQMLQAELMKDLEKKQKAEYKSLEKSLTENYTKQANEMPVYKLLSILQDNKNADGSDVIPELKDLKLYYYDLFYKFSPDIIDSLPKNITSVEGQSIDVVSNLFGFKSSTDMIQQLSTVVSKDQFIKNSVQSVLDQMFPNKLTTSITQDAINARHNEARARVVEFELKYMLENNLSVFKGLIKNATKKPVNSAIVRDQAKKTVGKQNLTKLKPQLYLNAENKARKEAGDFLAKGEYDKMFEAKKREQINHYLYKAAIEARDNAKSDIKDLNKKYSKKNEDLSNKRDIDLVNAGRFILSKFGLSKHDVDPDEFLKQLRTYAPERYEEILRLIDSATSIDKPFNELSVSEFKEISNALYDIWDLAKNEMEMEVEGKKVSLIEAAGEVTSKINEATKESIKKPGMHEKISGKDKFIDSIHTALSSMIRVEFWVEAIDGQFKGPLRKYIWEPINQATIMYRKKKSESLDKYHALLKEYKDIFTNDSIRSDELDYTFTKSELLMTLLHSGNESNLDKLLRGRKWADVNEDGTIDSGRYKSFINRMYKENKLTKRDFDFIQGVWDLMEQMKPDAQKAHKEMYGYYFDEITAKSFVTPFGNYRGGYIPAKVDTYTNEQADVREQQRLFDQTNPTNMFPSTGKGFTKKRVQAYAEPLDLNMRMLGNHIDSVLRFTYLEPRIKEVARLIRNKNVNESLRNLNSKLTTEMLIPWLMRVSSQNVVTPSKQGAGKALDSFFAYTRKSAAAQIMFGNLTNALQQITGIAVAGAKLKKKSLMNAIYQYVRHPNQLSEDIINKSEWMKQSSQSTIYQTMDAVNEIITNPSAFDNIKSFASKHAYFLQSMTQNMVNTIVWSAAYNEHFEKTKNENEAIKFADSIVRTTQGSSTAENISAFETGTQTELAFKQFIGYFNMLANLQASEITKIKNSVGLKAGQGKLLGVYFWGFALPAILSDIIIKVMSGKDLDEDDDGLTDEALSVFFGSQLKTGIAAIPYVGTVAGNIINRYNENRYDDRLSFSPAISILESSIGVLAYPYDLYNDKTITAKKLTRDSLTALGYATGLPIAPLAKPTTYLIDVNQGNIKKPTGLIDLTRGLITGKGEKR